MKRITEQQIVELGITSSQCVDWVTESFKLKYESQLPAKMSVHPQGIDFYTTMPCLLPTLFDTFGVKVVSRIKGRQPALKSEIYLYKASTGELIAIVESDWITAMRTGAVAALAIKTFQKKDSSTYSFMGLGVTAHATMKCLNEIISDKSKIQIKLLKYKNQAEKFCDDFSDLNLKMNVVDNVKLLIEDSDVVVSAITETTELICEDNSVYGEGVLLVPIHTRGFQNCDLFFDKIFADDTDHVKGFKYFSKFQNFDEISRVLLGESTGRENSKERILSYNIGLGLHDVYYAKKIYNLHFDHKRDSCKTKHDNSSYRHGL